MRRRHSVTSISPGSSPSQSSPPQKKLQTDFKPSFTINPSELTYDDLDVFEGFSSIVAQTWTDHHQNVIRKAFTKDSWSSAFRILGISDDVIAMISRRLEEMETQYTSELVWTILGMESIGTLALMVLEIEVYNYSMRKLQVRGAEEASEDSDADSSSLQRPDTPSPMIEKTIVFMPVVTSTSEEDRNGGVFGEAQTGNNQGEEEEEQGGDKEEEGEVVKEGEREADLHLMGILALQENLILQMMATTMEQKTYQRSPTWTVGSALAANEFMLLQRDTASASTFSGIPH